MFLKTHKNKVRFQILTAASMKLAVFWDVAPFSLAVACRRFGLIALMMEAASTSETSVNFYQTTRRNNHRRENLKTYLDDMDMCRDVEAQHVEVKTEMLSPVGN
jgi:hypothetical protein